MEGFRVWSEDNSEGAPIDGMSRRTFLGASAALTAAASLGGPTARAESSNATVFAHGVASGDPLSDRVILWTRLTPRKTGKPIPVRWVIARDQHLRDIVNEGVVTALPSRDWTVKVDADGLQPGQRYWYRFEVKQVQSPTGSTRTLPEDSAPRVRFAVSSCSNYPAGYFNAYARIADRDDLDAVIHLGDYIYEYEAGGYAENKALGRIHEPAHEIVSLADYRTRYGQYRTDPDLQAAHAAYPWICVWDDHESANDGWRDGAENHQADEGSWAERRAAAEQAWHEWMPVRERPSAGPSPIYRSFRFGRIADLIMLDTRLHGRTEQVADRTDAAAINAPGRTLLGADQAAWLAEELRASVRRGAAWHVIGQQLMVAQLVDADRVILNTDMWDGYPASRAALFDQLRTERVSDTVILTGDIHSAWAADLTSDPFSADYVADTGAGSVAVELVTTSVTSPGARGTDSEIEARERAIIENLPHIHYVNLRRHGYLLVDLDAQRVRAEWWFVDRIDARSLNEELGAAFESRRGTNHLQRA
jgi:alkaline phosphatase D